VLAGRPVEVVESAVEVGAVGVVVAAVGRRRYFSAREYSLGGWRLRDRRDGRDRKKKPHTRKLRGTTVTGDARGRTGVACGTRIEPRTGVAVNGGVAVG